VNIHREPSGRNRVATNCEHIGIVVVAARYDRGVGMRQKIPRKKHADLLGPMDRDPVAILARGDRTRVPVLVPVRHERSGRSATRYRNRTEVMTLGCNRVC
jgi:hypothetical protein